MSISRPLQSSKKIISKLLEIIRESESLKSFLNENTLSLIKNYLDAKIL